MNELLVDNQLKPHGIADIRVMQAFASVALEDFIPDHLQAVCYIDEAIYIKPERYILPSHVLAKMLQSAAINPNDRLLDIAFATGYSSAVLLNMSANYTGIDDDKDFIELAKTNLESIDIHCTNMVYGCPGNAPYDVILINGAIEHVPDTLLVQLAENGRLVAIVKNDEYMGVATLFLKQNSTIRQTQLFDINVPVLKGFKKMTIFKFW